MVNAELKKLTAKEFRAQGYLQELNRRFLHPLGLALEVTLHEDGNETFGEVWDCRDDPEGLIYGPGVINPKKAKFVYDETAARFPERVKRLGFDIQPDGEIDT
jgi:hypothetical protein